MDISFFLKNFLEHNNTINYINKFNLANISATKEEYLKLIEKSCRLKNEVKDSIRKYVNRLLLNNNQKKRLGENKKRSPTLIGIALQANRAESVTLCFY